MDDYPASYVARPRPLFTLSGLEVRERQEEIPQPLKGGPQIISSSPLVTGPFAVQLLNTFLEYDPDQASNEAKAVPGDVTVAQVKIKLVGRVYELPRRKANPVPGSPGSPSLEVGLHSALSPLSPSSPLYPDGVMHLFWNIKWQELVPSVFVSFLPVRSEPGSDESLKNEITALKTTLLEFYRIKLVVVLVGIDTVLGLDSTVEDRLISIRKGTKLDAKTSFFYAAPNMQPSDLNSFVQSIMSALRLISQEFYRDLSKHTRRKKDRWGGPAPSPLQDNQITSATSKSGWVARYEYKMGVLAEFRLEMDAASRHYFAALDALFDSDGVFENLSNWSPRWNEVRLFADTIAIRQVRCLLSNHLPMAAARFWVKYRDTTKYLMDRRGKGSNCYGWKAWEARWAKIMSELIQGSPSFAADLIARKSFQGAAMNRRQVYADSDRDQSTNDPFEPWDMLHHAGYWLIQSANLTAARRTLAHSMPEEDRTPPSRSPATRVARRHEIYDTYLCPEPHIEFSNSDIKGFDHSAEIVSILQEAMTEFAQREQIRMTDTIRLRIAKELIVGSRLDNALNVLRPLWQRHTWRNTNWLELTKDVASTLYLSAAKVEDAQMQIAALWELLSFSPHPSNSSDLMKLVNQTSTAVSVNKDETLQTIKLSHQEMLSFLDISFSFGHHEAYAGEVTSAQIVVTSKAHTLSAPVVLTSITIHLEGTIRYVRIDHIATYGGGNSSSDGNLDSRPVVLREVSTDTNSSINVVLAGASNLTVPGESQRIINVTMVPREAGIIRAIRAQAVVKSHKLDIQYSKDLQTDDAVMHWWLGNPDKPRKRTMLRIPGLVVIHPKLPKVKLKWTNSRDQYYIDEWIIIDLELFNEEATEVDATLEMRTPGHDDRQLFMENLNNGSSKIERSLHSPVLLYQIPSMKTATFQQIRVTFQAPSLAAKLLLEFKVVYEMESPLSNTLSVEIDVATLFEPTYTINADLHPAPWPSFFHMDDNEAHLQENNQTRNTSIVHRWRLKVDIVSAAKENICITKVEVNVKTVSDGAKCKVIEKYGTSEQAIVTPNARQTSIFKIDTQRLQLEDLRTTNVEAALSIEWLRAGDTSTNIAVTTIPSPRLVFPSGEPRVLVSQSSLAEQFIPLDLILENPSMHFLSFNVSLEPDESFAFSGAKFATKHVAPMSRHIMRYSILPFDIHANLRPEFKVIDIHFNKSLHINPADNVQSDEKGIWINSKMLT